MAFVEHIKLTINYMGKAIWLCPIAVIALIFAEGLQHYVEWTFGMYESEAMFKSYQSHPLRLGFGILKAAALILACYQIPKSLYQIHGPKALSANAGRHVLRKFFDPTAGLSGLIPTLLMTAPIIFIHYQICSFAISNIYAPALLLLDSVLIGFLAIVFGTSLWASDAFEHKIKLAE